MPLNELRQARGFLQIAITPQGDGRCAGDHPRTARWRLGTRLCDALDVDAAMTLQRHHAVLDRDGDDGAFAGQAARGGGALELTRHRGLLRRMLNSGRLSPWILKNQAGEEMVASVRPVMVLDDPEAIAAAANDMGIVMLPLPHALPLLERGTLARVLPEWHADALPLSIYYTSRKLVPAKVRVFVDYIVDEFRASGHALRFRQK